MIISTNEQAVEFGNVSSGSEFKIKASAKAFAILSSGLYSNKIKAIVRELSCNAIDSHRAAGKSDVKFDVHLPSSFEPYFYVRDYGTGLSDNDVIDIYTTYFESTKSNSNVDIGGLGLGSKSPFSYTQNFTVTSYFGGVKSIYSAYINENGFPAITRMSQEESSEPNGLEVRLAVNDSDKYKFSDEANSVYRWFKLQPNFVGSKPSVYPVEYTKENGIKGVHVLKNGSTSYALMGNVAYPIEVPNAQQVLGNYADLLSCSLVIEFGIGEVDIQPSREGLSYDANTIDNIKAKLIKVSEAVEKEVAIEFAKTSTEWERVELWNKLYNTSTMYRTPVTNYITKNPTPFFVDNQGKSLGGPTQYAGIVKTSLKHNITLWSYHKSYSSGVKVNSMMERDGKYMVSVRGSSVSIINNADSKQIAGRLKKYMQPLHDVVVFVAYPVDSESKIDFDGFVKDCVYSVNTLKIDDLPLLPKVQRDKIDYSAILETTVHSAYFTNASLTEEEVEDDTKTYYYVEVTNKDVLADGGKMSSYSYFSLYNGVKSLKYVKVYGIRKAAINQIKELPNWKPFEEFANKEVKKLVKNKAVYEFLALKNIVGDGANAQLYREQSLQKLISDNTISKTSTFYKVYEAIYTKYTTGLKTVYSEFHGYVDLSTIRKMANTLDMKFDVDNTYKTVYNAFLSDDEKISVTYPLLRYLDMWKIRNTDSAMKDVVKYINAV